MSKDKPKEYIGDGVYVEFSGYGIRLFSGENEIYIESDVYKRLKEFVGRFTVFDE